MSPDIKTEIVVIGAGPGGYVAAIRAAQLGKEVVLIEQDKLGGICLNYGCIPSKAMIYASGIFSKIKNSSQMGITAENVRIDFTKMQGWKNNIVAELTKGIEFLCSKNKVKIVKGSASFENSSRLKVSSGNSSFFVDFKKAIIASGSKPIELQDFKFDGRKIINSKDALYLSEVPKNLVVIGGGYIGLELGTVYAKLGSKVTVIEISNQVLPGYDTETVKIIHKNMEKMGMEILLNSKADKIEDGKVKVSSKEKGKLMLEADKVLVAVGRIPNSKDLGIENTKIKLDKKGFIETDKNLMTKDKNIYAIGDVKTGPMLAHKASWEGKMAAEILSGKKISYKKAVVPAVTFTDPEIATAGLNEAEAKKSGIDTITGKFPFHASSRAMTMDETLGFVKIIANKKDNRIIGVNIVGSEASGIISEAVLAIKMGTTLEELALTIHPHPSLSESLMEAAEATLGKAIHIFNMK